MKPKPATIIRIISLVIVLSLSGATVTMADVIILQETAHGEFTDTGNNFGGPNYAIAGYTDNRHAFMTFDLSGLSNSISSVDLSLGIESYQDLVGNSDFTVRDYTSGSDSDLALPQSGSAGVAMWQDLGDGSVYATASINPTTNPNGVMLALSTAAILDINSTLGGLFTIGIASDLTGEKERVRFDGPSQPGSSYLYLTEGPPPAAIPEPATLALMAFGLAGAGYRRRRLAA